MSTISQIMSSLGRNLSNRAEEERPVLPRSTFVTHQTEAQLQQSDMPISAVMNEALGHAMLNDLHGGASGSAHTSTEPIISNNAHGFLNPNNQVPVDNYPFDSDSIDADEQEIRIRQRLDVSTEMLLSGEIKRLKQRVEHLSLENLTLKRIVGPETPKDNGRWAGLWS